MKVTDTPVAVPAATSRAVSGAGQTDQLEQKKTVEDKVSVPAATKDPRVAEVLASGRAQRVQEIVNAVKSGQYYPSPQQIAQQLVAEAEVDARLRAMMS